MFRENLSLETARIVTPRALLGYARGLGWQPVSNGKRSDIAVFHRPDSPLHQVIIPTDPQLDDFGEAVLEAVRKLAEFEKLPASAVLEHLLLPPADLLRFREVSADAEASSLPLEHAVRLVNGMRKMLLATAHSVLVPQPYHPRLSRGEAEAFVARCRLGQTERGSFVLTIACPLDLQTGIFGPNQEPFSRRVTSLLMQSLRALSQATDAAQTDELVDSSRYQGISANLCESLLALRPAGDRAYLGVSVTWSRGYMPASGERRQEIQLHQDVFELAEALAPRLRSLPQPRVDRFFGFVDELRGNPGLSEPRPSGEVRFTLFDQEEEIHAKADLSVDDYAEAAAAHLETALVSFKGILQRLPRLNRIDNISDFKRVHLDDEAIPGQESTHNA
jgi:hypothetical protein